MSVLISGKYPDQLPDIAHTSLGDLQAHQIIELALQYQELEFHPQSFDNDSDLFHETQVLLNFLQHRKTVKNYKKTEPTKFYHNVKTIKNPCLWVFGCSHSYGTGLESGQRYSEILAAHLDLPLMLVAEPGSSLGWSLDQIHQVSIKPSDVVVWQITTPLRTTKFNGELQHMMLSNHASQCYLEVFTEHQVLFDNLQRLRQGINYLRSLGSKFVMTSLDVKDSYYYQYLKEYTQYPEYCYTPGIWKDLAKDRLHPGPLSNLALAKCLHDHLQLMT